jgi:hypothetical protein
LGPELLLQLDDFALKLSLPSLQGGGLLRGAVLCLPGCDLEVGADNRVSQTGRVPWRVVQDPDVDQVGACRGLDREPLLQLLTGQPATGELDGPVKDPLRGEVLRLAADDPARVGRLIAFGVQENLDQSLIAGRLPRRPCKGRDRADQRGGDNEPLVAPNGLDDARPFLPLVRWAVQHSP